MEYNVEHIMALAGIDIGVSVTVASLGENSIDASINDTSETIVLSNMVLPVTLTQLNQLFDICAGTGGVTLNEGQLKTLIVNVINGTHSTTRDDLAAAPTVDSSSGANYDWADYISSLQTHIDPDTYELDFRNGFIASTLGYADVCAFTADPSAAYAIRSTMTSLGFFDDFNAAVAAKSILGVNGNLADASDITINTDNYDASALFSALADAGSIGSSGVDISEEDGYALAINIAVSGSLSMSLGYHTDTAVTGTAIADVLKGRLISGTVIENISKNVTDFDSVRSNTTKVLLMVSPPPA